VLGSFRLRLLIAITVLSSFIAAPAAIAVTSAEATTLLNNCIAAINDPLYTRATLPGIMTYNGVTYANDAAIESALVAGTLTIWIATTSGNFGSGSGGSSDLFCGNFQDNTPTDLDSSAGKRDYFFGGAGNDSVVNMWESVFYGGPGNDSVGGMSEGSYFYGGPGTDVVTTIAGGSFFYQEDPDTTAPTFTSAGSFNSPENVTFVTNVVVNESSTITISAGDDQAKFVLVRVSETTAALSFITAPNFELPTDNGTNNTYALTVRAVDGSANATTQNILVTVTDVNENSSFLGFSVSGTPVYRSTIQISATISISARVSFKVDGKRIPGCISVATATTSPFVATCNWRPSRRGSLALTANATPVDSGYSASSATPLRVVVSTRSNER
jgi:uncharacterized protein YaiE (UPF0345 family)